MSDTSVNAVEPGESPPPARLRFTLVSGALILGAYLVLQVAATFLSVIVLDLDPSERMGDLVALGVTASAIPCTALVLLILSRKRGIEPRSWLALLPVRTTTLLGWVAFAFALLQLADLVTVELGRSSVPPIMETMIETTRYTTLLWFAARDRRTGFRRGFVQGISVRGTAPDKDGSRGYDCRHDAALDADARRPVRPVFPHADRPDRDPARDRTGSAADPSMFPSPSTG